MPIRINDIFHVEEYRVYVNDEKKQYRVAFPRLGLVVKLFYAAADPHLGTVKLWFNCDFKRDVESHWKMTPYEGDLTQSEKTDVIKKIHQYRKSALGLN